MAPDRAKMPVAMTAASRPEQSADRPVVLKTNHLAKVNLSFSATEVRAMLPGELEPKEDNTGFALFYTAGGYAGIPTSSAFYVGIYLKGRDAPDGSPGVFVANGYYSNLANLELAKNYSLRFSEGYAAVDIEGGDVSVRGGPKGEPMIEFALRRRNDRPPLSLGTHQYFGERVGGLTTYSLAFAAMLFVCEVASVKVAPNAPALLQSLTAENVIRANYAPGIPLAFSRPRAVAAHEHITAADASHRTILDVLSDLGKGGLVVSEDGLVLFSNQEGRDALGPLLGLDRVGVGSTAERSRLKQMIVDAAHGRIQSPADRMALHRPDGAVVIVQASHYRGGWNGVPTALLLLNRPSKAVSGDAQQGLELLGLTPWEARVAAQVGNGMSAREAADALALSENTVRSVLKLIYAKLAISNKAELANLVAQVRLADEARAS